jgi:predicted DNA-binding transcriptional regulator YafY
MRKADRLFQIIQILRRSSSPVTAAAMAVELEVSRRSVYRDIDDLIGQRVPIVGAAGFGYLLDSAYDMPPLMFTPDEIEAVVLGAQWVATYADTLLANAARDVVAKITHALPENLRPLAADPSVGAKPARRMAAEAIDIATLRYAIRESRKLQLRYRVESGEVSDRVVWPVILGYAEASRLLVAWCELRQGFRHFRSDRMLAAATLEDPIPLRRGELRRRWQRWREEQFQLRYRPPAPDPAEVAPDPSCRPPPSPPN